MTHNAAFFAILIACFLVNQACKQNQGADASGNFEATEVTISAEVDGIIQAFDAQEGQLVKRNEFLGYIDTTQLQLNKEQLLAAANANIKQKINVKSQLDVLRSQRQKLVREQNRFSKLISEGAATSQQLESIQDEINIVEKQIRAEQSMLQTKNVSVETASDPIYTQVKMINDRLRRSRIQNPVDGIVLKKYAERYEFAYTGRPLYKIADLSTMYLKVYLTNDQLDKVKLGERLKISLDQGDNTRDVMGTVTWISSKAEFTPKNIQTKEERVSQVYAVKLKVQNDGSLRIGLYGEVHLPSNK
jgi:HlyD family secretion protein